MNLGAGCKTRRHDSKCRRLSAARRRLRELQGPRLQARRQARCFGPRTPCHRPRPMVACLLDANNDLNFGRPLSNVDAPATADEQERLSGSAAPQCRSWAQRLLSQRRVPRSATSDTAGNIESHQILVRDLRLCTVHVPVNSCSVLSLLSSSVTCTRLSCAQQGQRRAGMTPSVASTDHAGAQAPLPDLGLQVRLARRLQ